MKPKRSKLQFVSKMSFILLIWLFMPLLAWTGVPGGQTNHSEDKVKITLTEQGTSLKEIIDKISAQTSFHFAYDEHLLDINTLLSIKVKGASLEQVLKLIAQQYPLKFKKIGNTIHMMPVHKAASASVEFQEIKVTGKVTADGEGLPGVNVLVKGSSTGTVTDVEGEYSINVPNEDDMLVFSSIGYSTQEVPVNGRTVIDVTLTEDVQSLEEVVVVGYGNQERSQITGAVEKIKNENLRTLPVATAADKLKGQAAGLVVSQPSGKPGANPVIRIRGLGSLGAGDNPLIIIDGFPVGNQIPQSLNPDDIESVSVLKDASSTAIYGARGANGVVLITTKQAAEGQSSLEYSTYAGFQNVPDSRRIQVLNAREYAQFMKETIEEKAQAQGVTPNMPSIYQNPEQYGEGVNWLDELIQENALIQNHNLTYTGGSERLKGVISAGYTSQEGILPNTSFNRFSLRTNINGDISDRINVGLNMFGARTFDSRQPTEGSPLGANGGVVRMAYHASPLQSPYNEDGSLRPYITEPENPQYISFANPIFASRERKNEAINTMVNASGFVDISLIKNLNYKIAYGVGYSSRINEYFRPSTIGYAWQPPPKQATASYGTNENLTWNLDNLLNYNFELNEHDFGFLLGYTAQKARSSNSFIAVSDFPNDEIQTVTAGNNTLSRTSGGTQWSLAAGFFRMNYNFMDKYLVEATFRREGASRFGENSKWGNFPSGSVGWRISEEGFFPESILIDDVKLRASYGITGNNNIGNFRHVAEMNMFNYVFNNSLASGSRLGSFANPNLGWEISRQLDIGLDVGLLGNRVIFYADYYTKTTEDMLFSVPIPAVSGFTSSWTNIGKVKNQGVEFTLNTKNLVKQFKWSTNFNMAYNQHEVVDLGGQEEIIHSRGNITVLGKEVGMFYGYRNLGIYNSQEDLDQYPGWGGNATGLGAIIYEDVNGDGKISPLDRTAIGSPHPDFTFGMTNNFSYKNFDLSILMSSALGYEIFNVSNNHLFIQVQRFNVRKEVMNRWRSPEDPGDGLVPTSTINPRSREWQSAYLEKGDHLWVKNITLAYNFPVEILGSVNFLKGARIYTSIQNAFLISAISESNPEVGGGDSGRGGSSTQLGINSGIYPVPRIVSFGANISF